MLFRLVLIILLTGLPALTATAGDSPSILVYGDSLSAAYDIPREQGWVALLQQRLQAQKFPHRVVNASVSGETTSGGLSRFSHVLQQHQPDIVLIALGANDGLRGLPVSEMRRNLSSLIQASLNNHAQVLLIGIRIPPNYGPHYTREFRAVYTELAGQYKLPLLPFLLDGVAGNATLTLDDGLHPNAQAQPRILDNVWRKLLPLLKGSDHRSAAHPLATSE